LDFQIISQMNFKCKEHLFKHERYFQEINDCFENGMNTNKPWINEQELKGWKEKYFVKYNKEYYEKHKKRLKDYVKTRINCNICNEEMNRNSLNRHKRRKH